MFRDSFDMTCWIGGEYNVTCISRHHAGGHEDVTGVLAIESPPIFKQRNLNGILDCGRVVRIDGLRAGLNGNAKVISGLIEVRGVEERWFFYTDQPTFVSKMTSKELVDFARKEIRPRRH